MMSYSSAPDLTPEILHELLDYNVETGVLRWKARPTKYFKTKRAFSVWNKRFANKRAFTSKNESGYFQCTILGRGGYRAHRVIWFMMTGSWPEQIDHINGNRTDNRWCNLRSVTAAENCQNSKRRRDNTSGVTGVCWNNKAGWRVRISVNGQNKHLGYFDTFEAACEMRSVAERNYLFHENHGRAA